jgi:cytochrome c1
MSRAVTILLAIVPVLAIVAACGWDRGASDERDPLTGGVPARGQDAIRNYGCGACHSVPGVAGADGTVGPPLDAFSKREYVGGVVMNSPENLILWVQAPQAIDPDSAMPNTGVTHEDARDIAAYLYTLR